MKRRKIFKILFFLILFYMFINFYSYANDELVYVDNNNIDTKYHRITCDHIFPNGYHTITVEEAFNIGYRRCSDCSPPMSDVEYNERLEHAKELTASISSSSSKNTSSVSTTSNEETDEDVVYVTSNGSRYHLESCSYLDNSSKVHKVKLRTAISKGYVPCKVCNPYGMAETEENQNSNNNNWLVVILCIALALLVFYIIFNELKYKRNKYYKIPKVEFMKKTAKNNQK